MHAERTPLSEIVPLGSRWQREVKVSGEPWHMAVIEITRVHDGWVSGRVVKGRGSRKGRTYSDDGESFLIAWERVDA